MPQDEQQSQLHSIRIHDSTNGFNKVIYPQQQQQNHGEQHSSQRQEIRIFMEGAFDMMHFGHMNAFRLGRSLGTHLVVGINSDESITECKAPPLMNHQDRLAMVQSCKFVDEVIPCTPYVMNKEYVDWILEAYKIDYIVHGDDPCIVDGKDVYETAKQAGKFRTIPRTEGVSTTDIVGRMLQLTKPQPKQHQPSEGQQSVVDNREGVLPPNICLGSQSKFLTTTKLLKTWDMFHPGHVAILELAKKVNSIQLCGFWRLFPKKKLISPRLHS
jgi:ethanolamine-phosphate cytidylyltransferase